MERAGTAQGVISNENPADERLRSAENEVNANELNATTPVSLPARSEMMAAAAGGETLGGLGDGARTSASYIRLGWLGHKQPLFLGQDGRKRGLLLLTRRPKQLDPSIQTHLTLT